MKKYQRIEMEIAASTVAFLLLIFLLSPNHITITGFAVADNPIDTQTTIQTLLRGDDFKLIGNGAKMCINVRNNQDEVYSYAIRKRGDLFSVDEAAYYCDGASQEDLVLTFEDYTALQSLETGFDRIIDTNPQDDFKIWESKYVKAGGLVTCDETFKERYCAFMKTELSDGQRRTLGLSCCDEVDVESPKAEGFMGFFKRTWWVFLIILICLGGGGVAMMLLSNKPEEETPADVSQQVKDYIRNGRQSGFGDIQIKQQLLDAGWNEADVDMAFDGIRKENLTNYSDRFEKVTRGHKFF